MVINLDDLVPLATIIGAAAAPTIAAIWAGHVANRNALNAAVLAVTAAEKVSDVKHTLVETHSATEHKLDQIHVLVNNQLTQAVERLAAAEARIVELKALVQSLSPQR